MIDIHSHILHGLDDGAKTFEESLEMIRMAAACGTTDIVATPHANPEFPFQPDLIRERVAELGAAIAQDPARVRIHTGCDFHLEYDNIQDALAHPAKYTINQRCYLLVEFSDLLIFSSTDDIFQRLRAAGILPIITHPERNWQLQQRIDDLSRWVDSGCYLQVTAQSFLGRFGRASRDFSNELMRRGLVHFLASDAHDCRDRPPSLREAYQLVTARWGERRAQLLCLDNPSAVLQGEPLEVEAFEEPAPRKKWYQFWA